MSIKQFIRLGLSLACLSSPMLLWMASPAGGQESNQSAATNPNATGSEVAPVFVPLPGGGTVLVFPPAVQSAVNGVAVSLNQLLAAENPGVAIDSLDITAGLPTQIIPTGNFELQLVLDILTGNSDADASLVSILETVPAPAGQEGTAATVPAPGAPPSGLLEDLVNSLVGLTANGEVDAGKLEQAVKAYNAAIKGATSAAYLSNPHATLLTIRAVLSRLVTVSEESTNAQAESK